MDELALGVVSHFTQQYGGSYHAFYTAISGKLYAAGEVPSRTSGPYATFNFTPVVLDNQELGVKSQDEFVTAEFQLWSETRGRAEVLDLFTKLKSWFDDCEAAKGNWAALSVSGYTVVTVDRGTTVEIPYDTEEGNQRIIAQYSIYLKKQ